MHITARDVPVQECDFVQPFTHAFAQRDVSVLRGPMFVPGNARSRDKIPELLPHVQATLLVRVCVCACVRVCVCASTVLFSLAIESAFVFQNFLTAIAHSPVHLNLSLTHLIPAPHLHALPALTHPGRYLEEIAIWREENQLNKHMRAVRVGPRVRME